MTIAPPLSGGSGLTGKSGRTTANVCETNARETKVNTAAHFMFAALITINPDGKQNSCAISVIRAGKGFFIEQRSLIHRVSHKFFRRLISPSLQLEKCRRSFACLVGNSSVAVESRCATREQKGAKFHIQVSNFRFRIIIQADATVCLSRP